MLPLPDFQFHFLVYGRTGIPTLSREPWNVNCVHVTAASDAAADDA